MALYASGKTVPNLDSTTTVTDSGLVLVHDGEELKKMTVGDFKTVATSSVSAQIDSEISRAKQAEAVLTDNVSANATTISSIDYNLAQETSRAQAAEQANTSAIADVKSSIPTVNNPTITIKQAGSEKGSFTLNQLGSATIELTDDNTTYTTGTASTSGLTKLYTDIGTATDGTMTQNALNAAFSGKSDTSHTHDERYYTETEVDNLLTNMWTTAHTW